MSFSNHIDKMIGEGKPIDLGRYFPTLAELRIGSTTCFSTPRSFITLQGSISTIKVDRFDLFMSDKRGAPRRNSPRVVDPLRIPVFWNGESGRNDGYLYDVSLGGCFLNTSAEAADKAQIVLEIPEPPQGEEVVALNCFVIAQQRRLKGFGLRFGSLSERQKAVLDHFIAKSKEAPDRRNPSPQ